MVLLVLLYVAVAGVIYGGVVVSVVAAVVCVVAYLGGQFG